MHTEYQMWVSYQALQAASNLPKAIAAKFNKLVLSMRVNPESNGINFETIEGSADRRVKSLRVDQDYRAVAYVENGLCVLLHVAKHDDAYDWARRRKLHINSVTNAVQVVEMQETAEEVPAVAAAAPAAPASLFAGVSDADLANIGVPAEAMQRVRSLASEDELMDDTVLTPDVRDALVCLAAGYSVDEVPELIGASRRTKPVADIRDALETEESRRMFWLPKDDEELSRMLDTPLESWRIFLHPDQRRLVERQAKGPVLVRGGAGTGKTVVAMHRAKWLAENMLTRPTDRVLFTTFTSNLAADIRSNLIQLCPELMQPGDERIEVKNLDAWVGDFLRKQGYDRKIVYFTSERQEVDAIWAAIEAEFGLPEGLSLQFAKEEWAQVVQAQGIADRAGYLTAPRTGRGTPLDRKTRTMLWERFEVYRNRLLEKGLSEPDDAYRDAAAILRRGAALLPYRAVVVDEAQDMGAEAFRLIRAIVPEGETDANSLFIVGDAHQRIYARQASMRACGINVRGRSSQLKVNYRTSDEIRRWAVALLGGVSVDDMDEGIENYRGYRSIFHGPQPDVVGARSPSEEFESLKKWLFDLTAQGVDLKDICVLAKTNGQLGTLSRQFHDVGTVTHTLVAQAADDRAIDGLRLSTMHRAKGLEFEAVAIVGLNAPFIPFKRDLEDAPDAASKRRIFERERSLVHVAATRAKSHLHVSWVGQRWDATPA